jgi:hypothetical protein
MAKPCPYNQKKKKENPDAQALQVNGERRPKPPAPLLDGGPAGLAGGNSVSAKEQKELRRQKRLIARLEKIEFELGRRLKESIARLGGTDSAFVFTKEYADSSSPIEDELSNARIRLFVKFIKIQLELKEMGINKNPCRTKIIVPGALADAIDVPAGIPAAEQNTAHISKEEGPVTISPESPDGPTFAELLVQGMGFAKPK